MCVPTPTTDIAICYGAHLRISVDEVFPNISGETLEIVFCNSW